MASFLIELLQRMQLAEAIGDLGEGRVGLGIASEWEELPVGRRAHGWVARS